MHGIFTHMRFDVNWENVSQRKSPPFVSQRNSLGTSLLFHSLRIFSVSSLFSPSIETSITHFHLVLLVMTTHSFIQFLPQIWNRLWTWLDLCKPNELRCDVFTMRSEMSYNNNTNNKKFKRPAFGMRRWLSTFRRNCDCKLFSPLVTRSAQYTSSYRISNECLTKWTEATTRCVCVSSKLPFSSDCLNYTPKAYGRTQFIENYWLPMVNRQRLRRWCCRYLWDDSSQRYSMTCKCNYLMYAL